MWDGAIRGQGLGLGFSKVHSVARDELVESGMSLHGLHTTRALEGPYSLAARNENIVANCISMLASAHAHEVRRTYDSSLKHT